LGNFFLLGSRLALEGYPAHVLVNPPKSKSLREIFDYYRLKIGQRTIQSRPRDTAFGEMVRVLRQKSIAVVIADEYRSGDGILVPFFGGTVLARRGPATLALRTRAPVIPAYLMREADGLTLRIEPEIPMSRTGKIPRDIEENTARMTRWVERVVAAYPGQWNWMNIRWQETPAAVDAEKEQSCERLA
jgi:KDO2-lipid IV(A) lauroyltransferase